mmetsp:Transcript_6270/g.15543  ORF Transcript_6270/g.15543 Transcript_6270/m.15543 type:complete len:225 (-) Transcript_6270:5-679(-)
MRRRSRTCSRGRVVLLDVRLLMFWSCWGHLRRRCTWQIHSARRLARSQRLTRGPVPTRAHTVQLLASSALRPGRVCRAPVHLRSQSGGCPCSSGSRAIQAVTALHASSRHRLRFAGRRCGASAGGRYLLFVLFFLLPLHNFGIVVVFPLQTSHSLSFSRPALIKNAVPPCFLAPLPLRPSRCHLRFLRLCQQPGRLLLLQRFPRRPLAVQPVFRPFVRVQHVGK